MATTRPMEFDIGGSSDPDLMQCDTRRELEGNIRHLEEELTKNRDEFGRAQRAVRDYQEKTQEEFAAAQRTRIA